MQARQERTQALDPQSLPEPPERALPSVPTSAPSQEQPPGRETPGTEGPAATQVAAGWAATYALLEDGNVLYWWRGRVDRLVSTERLVAISADRATMCGLTSEGRVMCKPGRWPIGGKRAVSYRPPIGRKRYVKVTGGRDCGCALGEDGLAKCWAEDSRKAGMPIDLEHGIDFGQCKAGGTRLVDLTVGRRVTCGVTSPSRDVECWGLGGKRRPTKLRGAQGVAVGDKHACAWNERGEADCWWNTAQTAGTAWDLGQVVVPNKRFKEVACGLVHSCGLEVSGGITCWGDNGRGQVTAPAGVFRDITAGRYHSCAVRVDGRVACWGAGQTSKPSDQWEAGQSIVPAGIRAKTPDPKTLPRAP